MDAQAHLPIHERPKLAQAWRSVHGDRPRQAFRVDGVWGMHLYRYEATVRMDGVPYPIHPGYAGFTPPGVTMDYHYRGTSVHIFAHLSWPPTAAPSAALPFMFDAGPTFPALWTRLEEAIAWRQRDSLRAEVRAWDVLLELADIATGATGGSNYPEAVQNALAVIESRLAGRLSAESVSADVGFSHGHLTRLFRQHVGRSIVETIADRRVERARHLLTVSNLPIKEIASLVGIHDLQQFNKLVRKHLGVAPSRMREVKIQP
jgi:AraC-like DNA-binding protein